MNRLIAIALLIGILTQSVGKVIVLLQYTANKEYIAATLCVNRDKPQMHCNGKCHLNKELAKEEQREKKNTLNNNEVLQVLIHQEFNPDEFPIQSEACLFRSYSGTDPQSYSSSVFHPPLV